MSSVNNEADKAFRNSPLPALAFLAEASGNIGTGHVVEILVLAGRAGSSGMEPVVWVNAETPPQLIERFPCPVHIVPRFDDAGIRAIAGAMRTLGMERVVTNLRNIDSRQITILKEHSLGVLCIDEWGGRHLDCDVVVNPSPVTAFHRYSSGNPAFRLCAGVEFLPLWADYHTVHAADRRHQGLVRKAVLSMGGVDRTGATINLAAALLDERPDLELHVVIGAGFAHRDKLAAFRETRPSARLTLHENLSSLAELFSQCDVGFTAGGNTLAELACAGTPALVAFEDPHEEAQGKAFQRRGFGCCLGPGTAVERGQVRDAVGFFDDPDVRARHCRAGKALVDGRGAERILDIAAAMLSHDSTFAP